MNKKIHLKELFKNLAIPVVFYVLIVIFFKYFALPQVEKNLIEEKKTQIKDLSSIAENMIEHYYERYKSGEITEEEAKQRVISRLRNIKYGPEDKDYFWILNVDKTVVMHPYLRELEGREISNVNDSMTVDVLNRMVDLANEKDKSFIQYKWEHYNSDIKEPKLSYQTLFKPWNWISGTGIYIHDIRQNIDNITGRLNYFLLISGVLIFIITLFVSFKNSKYKSNIINTNQELHKLNEYLNITLNSIGDAVIVTDVNGNVIRLNPIAENLTGWSLSEAKGKPLNKIFNIINSKTRKQSKNPIDTVLKEGVIVGLANHTSLISKNNEEHQIADSAAPIKDNEGKIKGAVLVFRDVTQEYEQREKIKEYTDLMNAATSNLDGILYSIDKDLKFTLSKGKRLEGIGLKPDEVIGMDLYEFFNTKDPDYPIIKKHIECLNGKNTHYYLNFNDRSFITYITPIKDEAGNVVSAVGLATDVTDYEEFEKTLAENEKKYRLLIENQTDLIVKVNPNGHFEFVSPSYCTTFGKSEEELIGKDYLPLVHPEDREYSDQELKRVFEPPYRVYFEQRAMTVNGWRWFGWEDTAVLDENENVTSVIGVGRDITEIKKAEEKLRISEERLRYATEGTNDGLWDLNLKTDKAFLSERYSTMLGYEPGELPNNKNAWTEMVHPDDLEKATAKLKDYIYGNIDKYESTFRMRTKKGDYKWIRGRGKLVKDDNGEPHRIVGFNTDITETVEFQKNLEERNEFIQTVLDNLPIGIALNKMDDGEAFYLNKKFTEIYGWSEEDITSIESFFEKVYPDKEYREKMQKEIMEDINSGDINRMQWDNIYITTSTNEKRTINAVNIPLISQNTMVSTAIDVTKQRKVEAELVKAKDKAEESDRLKSAFLANMSHEIRTPMNGIIGFTNLLKDPDCSNEEMKEYISIIQSSGIRMLELINDLIDISKIESGQMDVTISEVKINDQIKEAYLFFKNEAQFKGINLSYKTALDDYDAQISTDRVKFFAIMNNFTKNAIKYTNEGSIELGYILDNKDIIFYVKDTGIGIAADKLELIFDRFVQEESNLSKKYEGAGLGLSISRAYAEMLNGRVWVESEKDVGSTFYLALPYQKNLTKNKYTIHQSNANLNLKSLKMLLVEDDTNSMLLLRRMLKNTIGELITAGNGQEAVDKIKADSSIDVILMDIKMPVLNGYDATKKIREFNKDVIIIAQTAYALEGDKQKTFDAGCNNYIAKPIIKDELIKLLKLYF